jgi:hypothetical protein
MSTGQHPSRPSFLTRLRSRFDNSFTSGGGFVLLMLLATVLLAVVMTAVQGLISNVGFLTGPAAGKGTYFESVWDAFSKIVDHGEEPSWGERIIAILYWAIGIAVSGTIIGFITSRIQRLVQVLRKGRSPVVESGHTLILGWSPRIFPILAELAIANENVRRPLVVVFADRDREAMQDEIAARARNLGKLRVVTRRGDPSSPSDLGRTNLAGARSIIVLDAEVGDAAAVSTVLAIRAAAPGIAVPVVVEVEDAATSSALTAVSGGGVLPVRPQELVARVTAQASRQPGLATVMIDLLNFDGDEIYMTPIPELAGRTYGDALVSFDEASVIGYRDAAGVAVLNPAPSAVLPTGAAVIAIARDDDRVRFVRRDALPKAPVAPIAPAQAPAPERILLVGWSPMGRLVLESLVPFLPAGSSVHVAAREEFVPPAERAIAKVGAMEIGFTPLTVDVRDLDRVMGEVAPDEVVVLGYRSKLSVADADAMTMLTMLHLGRVMRERGSKDTRLIAEILDSRRAELAKQASADDLVVSDNLGALLIAQLAENPALAPVFHDLFDAGGATVNVVPVARYVAPGTAVTFMELVLAARERGESAIGYRNGKSGEVLVNPHKSHRLPASEADGLIVIGLLA